MKSFDHFNARTIKEAFKLLRNYDGKARLIAGGTDLLGALKDKITPDYPEAVINLKTISGLDYIKKDNTGLKIGALARLADIARSPIVKGEYSLLAEAAEAVATPQIRNMGTIGGNLCQDLRCWYYRYPHQIGGRILCYLKGGKSCYALTSENQYHSIFGGCREASPPCSTGCPGTIDIPSYLSKVREGDLREAARMLLDSNPLPSITGRVCPHSCEQECNRGEFDEAVSIRAAERFVGDYILENAKEIITPPETDTGKKVAIVGSGPAGLSAAYYLRRLGYRVTIFDRMGEPGGMLAYAIPAYRLPKDIVRRVIKALEHMGVEFRLKVDVGKDITVPELKKDFDSIFLASGAWRRPLIGLEGEELTKSGLQFLTDVNRGVRESPGEKVLVIGGGNVAADAGITALRLGAREVTLACLESLEEMPALPSDIEQAVEEAIKLMPSWGPHRIIKSDGKVKGMELVRCTSVFDKEGRFAPCFDDAVKETVEADRIIMAVGQSADLAFLASEHNLKVERGLIVADRQTQGTNLPGIFAGGEVSSGPSTVIEAIASGRRAAFAIDSYLSPAKKQAEDEHKNGAKPFLKFNNEYLRKVDRAKVSILPVEERRIDVEDAPGLGLNEVEKEANRCFNCSCVAVNSSDFAVALLALNARVKIAGPRGVRRIPAQEFFGSLRNGLEADEILTEIQIPSLPEGAKQTYLKFRLRNAVDFPIVSVASVITTRGDICKDARIALGAVAPRPFRATEAEHMLKGKAINAETAEAASKAALTDAIPLNKNAYKVEITKTLVKRAILS